MEQQFCQSCGMPLSEEFFSKNADGSTNHDYCNYCYTDGVFAENITMDQMIEHCLEYLDDFNNDTDQKMTKDEAREQMKLHFPTLKRWRA